MLAQFAFSAKSVGAMNGHDFDQTIEVSDSEGHRQRFHKHKPANPGVLRLDAALHSFGMKTSIAESAIVGQPILVVTVLNFEDRCCNRMEGGVEPPHSRLFRARS